MFSIDREVLYTGALLQHSNEIMDTKKRQSIKTQMLLSNPSISFSAFLQFEDS